jgi:hypothetical protein
MSNVTWFDILKTDWEFYLHPRGSNIASRRKGGEHADESMRYRGEHSQQKDITRINLPLTVPMSAKTYNRETGDWEIDYEHENLDEKTMNNLLDVAIHESGHAGIDKLIDEYGFPDDEKDELIDKWQKQAKRLVWKEIMAELNEHGGDLKAAIDSARRIKSYHMRFSNRTGFDERLKTIWDDTTDNIINIFEEKLELAEY